MPKMLLYWFVTFFIVNLDHIGLEQKCFCLFLERHCGIPDFSFQHKKLLKKLHICWGSILLVLESKNTGEVGEREFWLLKSLINTGILVKF